MNELDAQEQVRRLLAAAGSSPAETPEDVADRLDEVLAGLVAERDTSSDASAADPAVHAAASDEPGTVIPIANRRRRWPQVLVAAAAASVVALGIGNLALDGEGGADTAVTAEAGSTQDEMGTPLLSEGTDGDGSALDEGPGPDAAAPELARSTGPDADALALSSRPVRLRTDSLPRDVQLVEDLYLAGPASGGAWESACVRPATAEGDEWVAVRLDGERAVLVLRAPAGGRRTAEVFSCDDGGTPVASVTVRAR